MTRWLLSPLLLIPMAWIVGALVGAAALDVTLPSTDAEANALAPLPCGREIEGDSENRGVARAGSVRVIIAVDEEWLGRTDVQPAEEARSLLAQASALFRGTDIHLLPIRTETWLSPDDIESAEPLLASMRSSVSHDEGDIVVGFTAQRLEGTDGFAEVGGRYALASHHPGHPERDATVVAHEVAHLFGARHACDWPGHLGLMAEKGYDEPELLCPCTRRILEMNATRFHLQ